MAPEDPERFVTIRSLSGDLQLLDGRNLAQNGWFVVRTLLATKTTGKVAEWYVEPHTIPGWMRTPVIGFSQVGYHPSQTKRAVIELDPNDTPLETASLVEVRPTAGGRAAEGEGRTVGQVPPLRLRRRRLHVGQGPGPLLHPVRRAEDRRLPDRGRRLRARLAPDARRVVPGADGPHARERGLPRVARRSRTSTTRSRRRSTSSTSTATGPAPRPTRRTSPASASRGWPSAAGSTRATSTSRAARTPRPSRASWRRGRRSGRRTTRRSSTRSLRFVDIHRPDGKPDVLQQIEHGALQIAAQYRTIGRLVRGIVDGELHRYHHLGDASTQTDNLVYDPSLKPYQTDGTAAARPTTAGSTRRPRRQPTTRGSARSPRPAARCGGSTTALAAECLALAKKAYAEERARPAPARRRPASARLSGQLAELRPRCS